jgi:hypothetical protein
VLWFTDSCMHSIIGHVEADSPEVCCWTSTGVHLCRRRSTRSPSRTRTHKLTHALAQFQTQAIWCCDEAAAFSMFYYSFYLRYRVHAGNRKRPRAILGRAFERVQPHAAHTRDSSGAQASERVSLPPLCARRPPEPVARAMLLTK